MKNQNGTQKEVLKWLNIVNKKGGKGGKGACVRRWLVPLVGKCMHGPRILAFQLPSLALLPLRKEEGSRLW